MTTITLEGKEYQLDIEQAEKLGLLKEKKVKSWEEFKEKYPNQGFHNIGTQLTVKESYALEAFSKLLKLRRDWIGKWEPDWENTKTKCYVLECIENTVKIYPQWIYSRNLSFPTKQMAQEFLETFYDLIEKAKILI